MAINPNTSELLTFQELSNRPRKDVKSIDVKVAVCVYAFDLLYLDGQVSYTLIYHETKALSHNCPANSGRIIQEETRAPEK